MGTCWDPWGVLCGMAPSILAGALQESLQVLLCEPEVAANWEQGNKKREKVGLGGAGPAGKGQQPPLCPPLRFGRLQSLPAHKGGCLCSLAMQIKAPWRVGHLPVLRKLSNMRCRTAPGPSSSQ